MTVEAQSTEGGRPAITSRLFSTIPDLRILSGVEAGDPHLFPASVAGVLAAGDFERVLGSLHGIDVNGTLTGISRAPFERVDAHEVMRRCFTELDVLVGESPVFNVLAHCDTRGGTGRPTVWARTKTLTSKRSIGRCSARWAPSGRALETNTRNPMASVSQGALVVGGGRRRGVVRQ